MTSIPHQQAKLATLENIRHHEALPDGNALGFGGVASGIRAPLNLAQLVAAHKEESANELMEQIYATAVRFRGSEAFADDLTLIVLKVKGDDG